MERTLSINLRKLARQVEKHPHKYDLIRIQNFIFYTNEIINIPLEIWRHIFASLFDTNDFFEFLLNRPLIMAVLNKKLYNQYLMQFEAYYARFDFTSIKLIYNKLQDFIQYKIKPLLSNKRDILIVINNIEHIIYDITDNKTLGNYLSFVNNSSIDKGNLLRLIPYCDSNTRIDFHMSALITNCGGLNAICPFEHFETISIYVNEEIKYRKIWFVDKKCLETLYFKHLA